MTETSDRYEDIAREYYDPTRHPTSANFRQASRLILHEVLPPLLTPATELIEVGCGDSLLMEIITDRGYRVGRVTLIDSSPTMLGYSEKWRGPNVELLLGNAESLPIDDQAIDLVVSVLGDPYNTSLFWAEAKRILRPSGTVVFTTPSEVWARAYRDGQSAAVFDRADGEYLAVASVVLTPAAQQRLMEDAGLTVVNQLDVPLNDIGGPVSPKLSVLSSDRLPVVTAYVARRMD